LTLRCIGALVLLALFLLSGAHAQTLDQMQFSVQVSVPVLPLSQPLETRLRITNRSQYIEHIRHDALAELGIHKPGRYWIDFNYASAVSPAFTYGLPVWLGTQRAPLRIRVVD
jgi:hypothetical protein